MKIYMATLVNPSFEPKISPAIATKNHCIVKGTGGRGTFIKAPIHTRAENNEHNTIDFVSVFL